MGDGPQRSHNCLLLLSVLRNRPILFSPFQPKTQSLGFSESSLCPGPGLAPETTGAGPGEEETPCCMITLAETWARGRHSGRKEKGRRRLLQPELGRAALCDGRPGVQAALGSANGKQRRAAPLGPMKMETHRPCTAGGPAATQGTPDLGLGQHPGWPRGSFAAGVGAELEGAGGLLWSTQGQTGGRYPGEGAQPGLRALRSSPPWGAWHSEGNHWLHLMTAAVRSPLGVSALAPEVVTWGRVGTYGTAWHLGCETPLDNS